MTTQFLTLTNQTYIILLKRVHFRLSTFISDDTVIYLK
jgi:hypothetical protein